MAEISKANSDRALGLIRRIDDLSLAKVSLNQLSERTSTKDLSSEVNTVAEILNSIEKQGDKALIGYTEKFDGFRPDPLQVPSKELAKAWAQTPKKLKDSLELAHCRIKAFHEHQRPSDLIIEGKLGEKLSRRWRPVQKAGIYIPGGRAAYPSSVLMNAIPAKVAGVEDIVMVSPAGKDGSINQTVLAAAHLTGIKKIFRVGGAQAIGALAYGTEAIEKVDVISGPGNIYVTLAKKAVYGQVGIDSLAGPSEVLIIADHSAKVEQVAADLLAQAEHDPLAASILITTESRLAEEVPAALKKQLEGHPRSEICLNSLRAWGLIIVCKNLDTCIELSDLFAPEHLELLVDNPHQIAENIRNAGAIFIGQWTPEAVGDYLAGPNHTLPTSGSARFSGALCVETFMKNTSIIEFNKTAFEKTANAVKELATSEGLYSHRESINIRSTSLTN